jgi:hypothetical protein
MKNKLLSFEIIMIALICLGVQSIKNEISVENTLQSEFSFQQENYDEIYNLSSV